LSYDAEPSLIAGKVDFI